MKLVFALLWILTCPLLQAHPAWGIVVDEKGNIYFTDIIHYERGAVWKLTTSGDLNLLLSNFHAHNVSLDVNDLLVTAHGEDNHTMIRLAPDGRKDTLVHFSDLNNFFGGNATFSPQGDILFGIEHHFWKLNDQGKKEKISDYYFEWNQAIYADDDGNIYGPDIGVPGGILVKISPDGNTQIIAQNLITKLDRPYDPHQDVLLGMTKGDDGHMYIAETAGSRIIKIQDGQKNKTFFQSDEGWTPSGIVFFEGKAYILEFGNNGNQGPQITCVDQSGKAKIIFNYDYYSSQKNIKSKNKGRWNGQILIGGIVSLLILIYLTMKR